jgi:hypothetical protein
LGRKGEQPLPLPDKKIPAVVMIIGTFEIAIALLGLVILVLLAEFNQFVFAFLVLLVIYGAMGAGLWAIQEWARRTNVILHIVAVPYTIYTTLFLDGPTGWVPWVQLLISLAIVISLSQPEIRHKFQTVVPKQNKS